MKIFEKLEKRGLEDNYFWELFSKAEIYHANFFLKKDEKYNRNTPLNEKEFFDLLRFADIFSNSDNPKAKNLAYKTIAHLYEAYKNDEYFQIFSIAILSKIGNFPAIEFLNDKFGENIVLPLEREIEKNIKKSIQSTHDKTKHFTDVQYKIFQSLKNNNHFSFSGSTSLGKSFIIKEFIRFIISEESYKGAVKSLVILVPSKALITQVSLDLKKEFKNLEEYKILTNPVVPNLYKRSKSKFIFVLTPERLIYLLDSESKSKQINITHIFVDEAQKIVDPKNTRSPLYYHALSLASWKSIRLYFSSPNVNNPELFLKIFSLSTDEKFQALENTVTQMKYFLDLSESKFYFFPEKGEKYEISVDLENTDYLEIISKLGGEHYNIVYCSSPELTIEQAKLFAEKLQDKNNLKINELIKLIKEFIHEKYYLIDCLKKGVAFHFGKLPQIIRFEIEKLFKEGCLDYIFCTSTLLEGVNLPAKNIFILKNKIGRSKLQDIDFWNLAGRSGRLTKELSGNVIYIRVQKLENSNSKLTFDDYQDMLKSTSFSLDSQLISDKRFYKNVGNSLTGDVFTNNKTYTNYQKQIWDSYANILLLHEKRNQASILRNTFITKEQNKVKDLKLKAEKTDISDVVLSLSYSIKPAYQNKIYERLTMDDLLKPELKYDYILALLQKMFNDYNWGEEEEQDLRNKNKLTYLAKITCDWVNSKPLNFIIKESIKYFEKNDKQIELIPTKREIFNQNNISHVNKLINNLLKDIEDTIKFKFEKYFSNYYLLSKQKFGENNAGTDWSELLEYGTSDKRVIELQNIGFSRHLANFIVQHHSEVLEFIDDELEDIDISKLETLLDRESIEYQEFKETF